MNNMKSIVHQVLNNQLTLSEPLVLWKCEAEHMCAYISARIGLAAKKYVEKSIIM